MRRFLGVFGVAAILATTLAAPVAAQRPTSGDVTITQFTPTSMTDGPKTRSGSLAQSDQGLLARTDGAIVNIMVKMDVDPVASYTGGIDNLKPTSPGATGRTLKENGADVGSYQRYLETRAIGIRRGVQHQVPAIKLGRNFLTAYGGFSAQIPANKAKDLLKVTGVAAVQYDTVNHPLANDSPIFVGATQVWPSLGGESKAGQGVKLGVLDTGIWPEHPMLADPGIPNPGGGPYGCEFGLSGETYDAAFACNDKLIGAYAFLDTNLAVGGPDVGEYCPSVAECTARDADGHGTHTSTTAAGSPVDHSVLLGVDRGHISGIAPGASVIMYRVCDADGCYSSDSVSAVEQAIIDDVDVLNFSISGGSSAFTDSVELAFLDAYAAGILVNASAGNSGPGAATSDHAGPWTNTVGASTLDRAFATTLHLTADGGAKLDVSGVTVTSGVSSPTPVVLASDAPYSDGKCLSAAAGGTFTGKVVVCERGVNARIEKGYNVSLGGAAGMVLFNTAVTDLETDNHFLPAIHVNDAGLTIATFVAGHTGVMATWAPGTASPAAGDVMASFSSRGPLGDFIKPDVTAPGVQILAGESPHHLFSPGDGLGPDGEYYQAIAGTSMSSPHAAGVALLIKAVNPSYTPGQIKSAMMTSSVQDVVKEDGSTPADPFDMGAGSIRANRAVNPTVTFDVNAPDYFAAASDEFGRIDLNIASVNAPNMAGYITTTRTARNVTSVTQTLNITTTAPHNSSIKITPSKITLLPRQEATFTITIDATRLADGQYFGQIKLDPVAGGYNNAILPVAFDKHPGDVTLTNSCATPPAIVAQDLTIAKGDTAACAVTMTNYANTDAHVHLQLKAPHTSRLRVKNYSDGNKRNNGFIWNGTLSPALPPEILSLSAPGGGYLGLPGLGADPEGGYGDDTIGNYTGLPSFTYGGEVYDSLAIDSNGYVVVGGATSSSDNTCCNLAMPSSAHPNNVLAPYWTDLDASSHGDIYFAEVNFGGGVKYLVIEWREVPVYLTSNARTFQLWMAETTIPEEVTFEYCVTPNDNVIDFDTEFDGCDDTASAAVGPGASSGLVVGAENRDGSSAATIGPIDTVPMSAGYVVHAGTPIAGGTKTITYDAYGKRPGTFLVAAKMSSDVTQGIDLQRVRIHVVNP